MNYKGKTNSIFVAGTRTYIPSTSIIKHLMENTGGSSSADAMLTVNANAPYVVTAGKTFALIGVIIGNDGTGGGTLAIWEGATEDAVTTLKWTLQVPSMINSKWEFSGVKTFASGKYITIVPSTTTVDFVTMIGYEF